MKKLIAFVSAAIFLIFAMPAFADTISNPINDKQMVNINASGEAVLAGKLKSINTDSLIVSSWGGDWTVVLSSSTKLLRRFDGKANLSEFVVGDAIQVNGKASMTNVWTIDARKVQDNSIQTRNASFSGTISNMSSSTFTLTTKKNGMLQVMLSASTTIKIADKTGSVSDLTNGLMVTVSGVWNTQASTLTASKVVVSRKDMEKQKKENENREENDR